MNVTTRLAVVLVLLAACKRHTPPTPTPADGGKGPFGAACTKDGDCESGACSTGKKESFCTLRCKSDAECPKPLTAGECNGRGFCKR